MRSSFHKCIKFFHTFAGCSFNFVGTLTRIIFQFLTKLINHRKMFSHLPWIDKVTSWATTSLKFGAKIAKLRLRKPRYAWLIPNLVPRGCGPFGQHQGNMTYRKAASGNESGISQA